MSKPFEQAPEVEGIPTRAAIAPQVRQVVDRSDGERRRRPMIGGEKLGVDCSKLMASGLYCHWINDYPNRVNEALANGYEFVLLSEVEIEPGVGAFSADSGERVSRIVGHNEQGGPLLGYLMKIKQEWKNENDAFYQKRAAKIDAAIRSGTTTPVEGAYTPKGGIDYGSSLQK
jgi:hypothetical protein